MSKQHQKERNISEIEKDIRNAKTLTYCSCFGYKTAHFPKEESGKTVYICIWCGDRKTKPFSKK